MIKKVLHMASQVIPGMVSRFVYYKMSHPRVTKLRPHEADILGDAKKEVIRIGQYHIQTYKWPGGEKEILLVHGWEGQAGNFSAMVHMLRGQAYTVYAFDGPSHGQSSRKPVTFFDFSKVVAALLRKLKVRRVVCHSFGSVATIYALYQNKELNIDQMVLLTTPNRFMEFVDDAKSKFNLPEMVCSRVVQRIQKKTGYDISDMAVKDFVQALQARKVLLIHDRGDTVLPIERSRIVCQHWPACRLVEVEGTGHFKILRSPEVLDTVLKFLNEDLYAEQIN